MRFNEIEDLEMIDRDTAAVLVETARSDASVRLANLCYMQDLRMRCDEVGALLILDEIQAGFGRTGKFFAFEHYGIKPDILTIAKSMAGGMHMGAFISSAEIMKVLSTNPMLGHITTFGSHPIPCVASLATIAAIQEENLIDEVEAKGKYLEEKLHHPSIKKIRRIGLMFAVEFESAELVYKIVDACLERGVITFYFLSCPESFRLAPPWNISYEEMIKPLKELE